MEINSYNFGLIVIENITYHKDLIIFDNKVQSNWWRQEGHLLQIIDIKDLISSKPCLMIIGTGASGKMIVSKEVIHKLNEQQIKYKIFTTPNAVDFYNKLVKKTKVFCALHLTC